MNIEDEKINSINGVLSVYNNLDLKDVGAFDENTQKMIASIAEIDEDINIIQSIKAIAVAFATEAAYCEDDNFLHDKLDRVINTYILIACMDKLKKKEINSILLKEAKRAHEEKEMNKNG
jgi:hypothetical protein